LQCKGIFFHPALGGGSNLRALGGNRMHRERRQSVAGYARGGFGAPLLCIKRYDKRAFINMK